jgi:choice-of-anchor B domain-containing protein
MRKRLAVSVVASMILTLLVIVPAGAHHDDGKGDVTPAAIDVLMHEFENVTAPNAAEEANAPRGHAPCIKGMAADTFPCDNVDMLSHLTLGDLGLSYVNDMWGWTDPQTKKDYALVGGAEGTVIVDISDPKRPDVVGTLPTRTTGNFIWRDIKVYADHMYVVSEDANHGLQVLDLTQVRGVTGDPVTFEETAVDDSFSSAHNLHINTDTGYAYIVGADTCAGGLHVMDVSDPASPSFVDCYSDHGYIHDTQCVVYEGPDADYRGHEICFNSAAQFFGFSPEGIVNTLSVVDVTDKANMVGIANYEYADDGYSHQGWLTPDQAYFLHNDELDEFFGQVSNTTTRIFDVRDLDAIGEPVAVAHDTTSIGHNQYTEGSYVHAANYTAGYRVYDTSNVADGEMPEAGYFDTYPENDNPTFEGGPWSNYPYFHQKQIVGVSSQDRGLFVLRPRLRSGK